MGSLPDNQIPLIRSGFTFWMNEIALVLSGRAETGLSIPFYSLLFILRDWQSAVAIVA